MAQYPFIHIPDGIYSVVSKCNNDEFLFDAKEKFECYIRHMITCKRRLGFTMYDICCVSNHVHELYRVTSETTIVKILHTVRGHFSQKFNAAFRRGGHFWRNKPCYRIVENEGYAFNLMYYYHWNPVKAGLVDHPAKWPYSGYRFHLLNDRNSLLAQLLDPLPEFDIEGALADTPHRFDTEIERFMARGQFHFIGSPSFVEAMAVKYP